MKWISNIKTKPIVGNNRYVMKFAFLPVYAWSYSDKLRYKVWLESYKQEQMYKEVPEYLSGYGIINTEQWVNINNYIK